MSSGDVGQDILSFTDCILDQINIASQKDQKQLSDKAAQK